MRLVGGIDGQARPGAGETQGPGGAIGGSLPGRQQRHQRCRGCRVLDDAGEPLRQPEHLPQPLHRHLLQLGGRGRGRPRHALGAERGGEHLSQDGRGTVVAREIGEPAGVIPVGHPGNDDAGEVLNQRLERLTALRRRSRQLPHDVTRSNGGCDRELAHISHVVGHPVDQLVAVASKVVWVHAEKMREGWKDGKDGPACCSRRGMGPM